MNLANVMDRVEAFARNHLRYGRPEDGGAWWLHWQNLNERRRGADGRVPHGPPTRGRAWLKTARASWHVEWVLGGYRTLALGFTADPDCEGGFSARVGLPPCALFVGLESRWAQRLARRWCGDRHARAVEGYVAFGSEDRDGAFIHWNLWTPTGSWSRATPAWRNGGAFLWSLLFGPTKVERRELVACDVIVPMPEGGYPGRATLTERTWTRPRWPGVWDRSTSANVAVPGGVPVPGKGTTDYNCDDDAIYELSTAAGSVAEAVGKFVASALRTRAQYGGSDWRPAPKAAAAERGAS